MRTVVIIALISLSALQVRMRLNVQGAGGGTNTTFGAGDLTLLGAFRVPGGHQPMMSGDPQPITFRKVSGTVHVLVQQAANNGDRSSGFASFWEYADPGSYSTNYATAPQGTFVQNWGQDGGGSAYDMFHALYGKTICTGNSPWSCTVGTTVQVGSVAGVGSNYVQKGAFFHDDGSGHCCLFGTYGQGYSNYGFDSNVVMADLISAGNVNAYGPFRTCAGTSQPGAGVQMCGPNRGFDLWDAPDGSMGIGGGPGFWQQSTDNKGPSAFWGGTWITSSTPQGYGSTRGGNANYRSTDIVVPTDGLGLYSLDSNILCDGTIQTGGNVSFRRTTDATYGNYTFEGQSSTPGNTQCLGFVEEIDPTQYSGVGSWSSVDYNSGAVWVNTSPKSGYIVPATLANGHVWYKTLAGYTYYAKGTGSQLIFQRNAEETVACPIFGNANADVQFAVKPAFYQTLAANAVSIQFINPGTANQSASVTHSGNAVAIHLATNGSSQVTTTAANVVSLIAGDSFANTVFTATTGTVCTNFTSDGSAAVDTITDGRLGNGSFLPVGVSGGVLVPAAGPQFCPLHNDDAGFDNTGPVSTSWEPALIIYNTAALLAAPTSGNPDYTLDPSTVIFLHSINAGIQITDDKPPVDSLSGVYYDYFNNRLYVGAPKADRGSVYGSFTKMPLIYVFSVSTSAPQPLPYAAAIALPSAVVLWVTRKRR